MVLFWYRLVLLLPEVSEVFTKVCFSGDSQDSMSFMDTQLGIDITHMIFYCLFSDKQFFGYMLIITSF